MRTSRTAVRSTTRWRSTWRTVARSQTLWRSAGGDKVEQHREQSNQDKNYEDEG